MSRRDTVVPVLYGLTLAAWMAPFVYALNAERSSMLIAGALALAVTALLVLVDSPRLDELLTALKGRTAAHREETVPMTAPSDTTARVVHTAALTEQELQVLRLAQEVALTPGERRELLWYLDVAEMPAPAQRVQAAVERILGVRAASALQTKRSQ